MNYDVGQEVVWNSKTGPVLAEYRGKLMGMDGWEATIIVYPENEGECPFQTTVPLAQLSLK